MSSKSIARPSRVSISLVLASTALIVGTFAATTLAGGDETPPTVSVISPNGGESINANTNVNIFWSATDDSGVLNVDVEVSDDGGTTWRLTASNISNTGSVKIFFPNRPGPNTLLRISATDFFGNVGSDISDAPFTVVSPPGGTVGTTLRDFDMPGTQPLEAGFIDSPLTCAGCHGNYNAATEPYRNWQGSMMAVASIDPLFLACLTVANQDAPDSGDLCIRCHVPNAWLQGRSIPTDGSAITDDDRVGVSCDFCHRMVDPFFNPGVSPAVDQDILNDLQFAPSNLGIGKYVIDPAAIRRGPFPDADLGHEIIVSPFHQESSLCATCHDVSNPAYEPDGNGNWVANLDAPAADFSPHSVFPIERTYSEWLNSDYNTPTGVFAPQFGGNKDFVASCQDCHMRDITGQGCAFPETPVRTNLPLHDLTGGSTWLPALIPDLYPDLFGVVNEAALLAGIDRARYMLQNAASLNVTQQGALLQVRITNETGHKLPTGYPEGRRMWINVQFRDSNGVLVGESAAYDPNTGVLTEDPAAKIYEAKLGFDQALADQLNATAQPTFHFVLNNKVYKDNRIPPRGFTNAAFEAFGAAPVAATYTDGQYWDDTFYLLPASAVSAEVTVYYQSTSKEYVEFLRDENFTDNTGIDMFNLWNDNGKCPPELMVSDTIALLPPPLLGDADGDGNVDLDDFPAILDCLQGPIMPFPTGCGGGDFNFDADVDLADFAEFATLFGP